MNGSNEAYDYALLCTKRGVRVEGKMLHRTRTRLGHDINVKVGFVYLLHFF